MLLRAEMLLFFFFVPAVRGQFYLIAGLEGTGHHLWNEIGAALRERMPWTKDDALAVQGAQWCWSSLAEARAPCQKREDCHVDDFNREKICGLRNYQVSGVPLYLPSCSYPCGSPKPRDLYMNSSPDLPQFLTELGSYTAHVIVMVRDPIAAVRSSYFRRHQGESTFRATAFSLYLHLGYLDSQLDSVLPETKLFLHYDTLVSRNNSNALTSLSTFLAGVAPDLLKDHLAFAVAKALGHEHHRRRRRLLNGGRGLVSLSDKFYVAHLFFRTAAKTWIPTFWPELLVYRDAFLAAQQSLRRRRYRR